MPSIAQQLAGLPRKIRSVAARNLEDAARALEDEVREVLSVRGSREDRSRPGEAPRYQTGRLYNSVHREVDGVRLRARVIAGAPYSSYLIAMDRPFLAIAFRRARGRIDEIMARY